MSFTAGLLAFLLGKNNLNTVRLDLAINICLLNLNIQQQPNSIILSRQLNYPV